MRFRRLGYTALVLLAAGAALAAAPWGRSDAGRAGTAKVTREDFRELVEATGRLETAVAFEIGPPSVQDFWEYNLTWMIPEGSRVKKGDVIARFDPTQIEERLREHRAARETAVQEKEKEERNLDVSLRQLRLDLVKAEGELKKIGIEVAVPDELRSSIEVEQSRLKQDLAQQRVDFLREKIDFQTALVKSKLDLLDVKRSMAEGKISYNEEARRRYDVQAPVSGLVQYIPKRNGDRWEVGESVWMLAKILKVADISTLRVEADVLEVDAARLSTGQPAEIKVDALPQLRIDSRIAEIGRMVREKSVQDPSKVFDAILPLDGVATDALRPGMGVHVTIEARRLPAQLTVPLEAVRVAAEGTYVEVVGGSAAGRRVVTLGARNRDRVVVQSGLAEGEEVRL
jgi:HlyD family secretion protein